MVGALVKVEECTSRIRWIGSYGVIVGQTKNTIRLAVITTSIKQQQQQQQQQPNLDLQSTEQDTKNEEVDSGGRGGGSDNDQDEQSHDEKVRILVVPKKSTKISIIVPLSSRKRSSSNSIPGGSDFVSLSVDNSIPQPKAGVPDNI